MKMRLLFVCCLMVLASATTAVLRTPNETLPARDLALDTLLPEELADWSKVEISSIILPAELELEEDEAVLYRAYRDRAGRMITLVAAYGPPRGDSVRLHRPESCYVAQGFSINTRKISNLDTGDVSIPVIGLRAQRLLRGEAVSYWLRDGDAFVTDASSRQWLSLKSGLQARTDSALIRISSPTTNLEDESAEELHRAFLSAFVAELSPEAHALFIGPPA